MKLITCALLLLPWLALGQSSGPVNGLTPSNGWTQVGDSPQISGSTPAAPPAPTPAPRPTPNPALGALKAVTLMYPQLAVKDSVFNLMFRDYYLEALKDAPPEVLAGPNWPFDLADAVAKKLGIAAKPIEEAAPALGPEAIAAAASTPTPTPFAGFNDNTALDKGVYDEHRNTVHNRPYWYWWRGQ